MSRPSVSTTPQVPLLSPTVAPSSAEVWRDLAGLLLSRIGDRHALAAIHIRLTGAPDLVLCQPPSTSPEPVAPQSSPITESPAVPAPLVCPIHVDGRLVGHLEFHSGSPGRIWQADDTAALHALAETLARTLFGGSAPDGAPVVREESAPLEQYGIRPQPQPDAPTALSPAQLPPITLPDAGRLHILAFLDPVTGLPNRHALAHSQTGGNTVIALRILDRIDPTAPLSPSDAPAMPMAVADAIRAALETWPHLLVRSGESGLAVITEADAEDALKLARAIRTPFKGLLKIGARRLPVQISIGIAQGDRPLPQLLMDAEFACHPERAGAIHRFETALRTRLQERQQLEADLFTALQTEDPGFSIALQPTVALESGIVVGFEVLARWLHPERGAISPAVFVPMAESTGLMLALGTRVLELAARTVQRWNQLRSARDLPPVFVSANLSAHQFMDPDLIDALAIIVGRTRVAPGHLRLELTEATLMARPAHTAAALGSIARLGIGLSIDDFGHGPSCLGHLHRFTVDAIKIDRQFVAGVSRSARERTMLSALIQLARTLGLEPVAEGIEAADTASALVAMGCALGQGFHFGRPMAVEEAEALILPPV